MDNFREWLSDNLRYFMLGGAILAIVAVLFFGIRFITGNKKGSSGDDSRVVQEKDDGNQENVPSSPADDGETDEKKDENPLETGNDEITELVTKYYKALGEKDIVTLRTLVDNLNVSNESRITSAKDYIEGYEVRDVYVKKGLTDDSYVVYASYYYICQGIDTKVPALSELYVKKDSDGTWKIEGDLSENEELNAYTESLKSDSDVKQLTADIKKQNDEAREQDAVLAEFLNGLGSEETPVASAEDGATMVVTEGCNVRAEASSEGDIIGGLSEGTEIQKLGSVGEWIRIEYEGQEGYVHSSLLEEKTE